MNNDNVSVLQSDMRLKNLYEKIWGALEESNKANPLSNAACIGILQMVVTELSLTGLGLLESEDA